MPRAQWRHPQGPQHDRGGLRPVVGQPRGCAGLCPMGRQTPADRGRMGVRRAVVWNRPHAPGVMNRPAMTRNVQLLGWIRVPPGGQQQGWRRGKTGRAHLSCQRLRSYDMTGNAWQWVADWYADHFVHQARHADGPITHSACRLLTRPNRRAAGRTETVIRGGFPVQRRLLLSYRPAPGAAAIQPDVASGLPAGACGLMPLPARQMPQQHLCKPLEWRAAYPNQVTMSNALLQSSALPRPTPAPTLAVANGPAPPVPA